MIGPNLSEVDAAYREAVRCRSCFSEDRCISPGEIDIAQPRWVGELYMQAQPRVLFVLINPGSGKNEDPEANNSPRRLIHEYLQRTAELEDILQLQCAQMPSWGRGRFLKFYTDAIGLKLGEVAFVNVALCSTRNNPCPGWMLTRCFDSHSYRVITALDPDLVILSGVRTRRFRKKIVKQNPRCRVELMFNYAHRKGAKAEAANQRLIRKVIEGLRDQSGVTA